MVQYGNTVRLWWWKYYLFCALVCEMEWKAKAPNSFRYIGWSFWAALVGTSWYVLIVFWSIHFFINLTLRYVSHTPSLEETLGRSISNSPSSQPYLFHQLRYVETCNYKHLKGTIHEVCRNIQLQTPKGDHTPT